MYNSKYKYVKNQKFPEKPKIETSDRKNGHSYGLTSPISLDYPTPEELTRTTEMFDYLTKSDVFETEEGMRQRQGVVEKLDVIFKKWVRDTCIAKRIPEFTANKAGGIVIPMGSYILGTQNKGSDLDLLCVGPLHVERKDFFTSFYKVLSKLPNVTKLNAIENAFVPIITFSFDDVEIDLLFARLLCGEVAHDIDLMRDDVLKYLDPRCSRSIGGYRSGVGTLQLVPDREIFKATLRAVKFWAKRRGVYGNAVGFLGGISWAILVARICQLYPNATPSTILSKFFRIIRQWPWPLPLLLRQLPRHPNVWDPRLNLQDRTHKMPIVTPCFPQQNSTVNVTVSTRSIVVAELNRGHELMTKILEGKATWDDLFQPAKFFDEYNHFIAVRSSAASPKELAEWSGFIQSRLRLLVSGVESCPQISVAHPLEKSYPSREHSSVSFVGMKFNTTKGDINLTNIVSTFADTIIQQGAKFNIFKPGMTIKPEYVNRKNLNKYIPDDVAPHKRETRKRKVGDVQEVSKNKRICDNKQLGLF